MERKVLATIGEKEITNYDVESALQSLEPYQAMHFNSEQGKKQLLDDLVNQELFYMEAKENELHNDEEFKKELQRVQENMLKQYAINKVLTSISLTEEEKKAFFDANKDKFHKPETATAKHILVETEEQANDLLNKIKANEVSFEDAASEHSTCPSKEAGGNLGSFPRGQMVPEFEEAVFNMEKGEVAGPVKTQFGYHLIKLEDLNKGGESEYEEVKNEIERTLMYQKQTEVYSKKLNDLRSKYGNMIKLND
ncbi:MULTISPECIES: peptidylprolyl isomerase [Romboutsia]|uniref:Peptidyl-prolyl cis-trans isomerase n=1 Tax=Romboutsia hominis TaxID=1507512 RepID=A0A2P2BSZ3_9FIRM|nr:MULTISPECIES: peptidylprolyl isomerase [Romboutsia]MCH1960764.1 peptidylprolyl isomerase [Romboutsia hominis]MCH1968804.1 peptidylprolyl isomerase [Romboutsia hominis]MDB8793677.1 peptidylprolyl isomerase [Romboutsia sp. 1001216sp1]MDB8795074.1 peptidylprolyl isomerase [Romboutsia sp. 1001216sp1]MDB8798884.1 peptidylprolyl isomerase [Romboutsia sp. 1001216sp1]